MMHVDAISKYPPLPPYQVLRNARYVIGWSEWHVSIMHRMSTSDLVDSYVWRLSTKVAEHYTNGDIALARLYVQKLNWVTYMDCGFIDAPVLTLDFDETLRTGW